MSDRSSIEWTDATQCSGCGIELTALNRQEPGRRRCKSCRNSTTRERYQPKGKPLRSGPAPQAARSGDKRQARKRVNQMVLWGRLARPNDLPCYDCGHRGADRCHEYDHFLGYSAEHHLAVQAVCSVCHHRRAAERGESRWTRVG